MEYEYIIGFEGDSTTGLWKVFAKVSVNRNTENVTFLDYRTPAGNRMENPPKPISFTQLFLSEYIVNGRDDVDFSLLPRAQRSFYADV